MGEIPNLLDWTAVALAPGVITLLKVPPWVSWGVGFLLFQVTCICTMVGTMAAVSSLGLRSFATILVVLCSFFVLAHRKIGATVPSYLGRMRKCSSLRLEQCGGGPVGAGCFFLVGDGPRLNIVATVLVQCIFSPASSPYSFVSSRVG